MHCKMRSFTANHVAFGWQNAQSAGYFCCVLHHFDDFVQHICDILEAKRTAACYTVSIQTDAFERTLACYFMGESEEQL